MSEIVYIRMKQKINASKNQSLCLSDVAYISAPSTWKETLESMKLYTIQGSDRNIVIMDVFRVIYYLRDVFPDLEVQPIGPNQSIVMIQRSKKNPSILLVIVIWLLLFIGAAMAIINFHFDVSMEAVQQRIHFLLTGKEVKHPLWLEIPYSIGLGLGMILFFNHLFKKRINEEPSPLEIEMHKYQQDLDQYVVFHENELSKGLNNHDDTSS
ncbi:stage V sporulation protein AA [Pontibacillus salicampi]|uniref:Stage V sporulation protein AA n=1 Tax=Pontibacillus salicampi TaxID=1449801 RepID=A0ABV6LL95_9BACI